MTPDQSAALKYARDMHIANATKPVKAGQEGGQPSP